MYNDVVLDRFFNPTMAGDVEAPSATAMEGSVTCGDVVQIAIRFDDGTISEAKFRTLGCAVAIAASDALCELLLGKTLTSAEVIQAGDIYGVLGGVPVGRHQCALAPLGALRSALHQIRSSDQVR